MVKEEISDEEMNLPCFNGRVVAWVSIVSQPYVRQNKFNTKKAEQEIGFVDVFS